MGPVARSFFREVRGADPLRVDDAARSPVPWAGPPPGVRPGVVALAVELGRSASTVVGVEGARAYGTGVVLRLVVHVRETGREARRRVFAELDVTHGRGQLDLALPVGGLRWGVELADGRQATTLDESPWASLPDGTDPEGWLPPHPFLEGIGRPSVHGGTWSRDVWLWPLPPPGALRLLCAWPDRAVDETATPCDVAPLRAGAREARPLW